MKNILVTLLVLNGLWNIAVWPRFFVQIIKDKRSRNEAGKLATTFFIVHAVLVAVALTLGVLSIVFGLVEAFS